MNIPCDRTTLCKAGESIAPELLTPGDFLLFRKDSFYHRLIQIGQSFRFPRMYSQWTHCALVVHENGTLLEADSGGIIYTNSADYEKKDYIYVHIQASSEDRAEAVAFAKSCHNDPYSWFQAVMVGICLLSGLKIAVGFSGTDICSGFVAKSLERTTAIFPLDDKSICPSHLAMWYKVNG